MHLYLTNEMLHAYVMPPTTRLPATIICYVGLEGYIVAVASIEALTVNMHVCISGFNRWQAMSDVLYKIKHDTSKQVKSVQMLYPSVSLI